MKQKVFIFLLIIISILLIGSCRAENDIKITPAPSILPTITSTFSPTNTPTPIPTPTTIKIGEFGKAGAEELLWSPDGKYLVVRTSDEVDLVNTQTWEIETSLDISMFDSMETQMFFEPQGTVLYLVIERDYRRDIWQYDTTNVDKKRFVKWKMDLKHSFGSLFYLSPCSKYLAIAEQNHLEIMDLEDNGSREIELMDTWGFENEPNAAVFSQDESQIALGMQSNVIKVINPESGKILLTLNHESHINDLTYTPNDDVLVSASNDATVKFWNPQNGNLLASLDEFRSGPAFVRYFDNGSKLLIGEEETNKFYIYRVDEKFLPVELEKTTTISEGSNIHFFEFNSEAMEIALINGGTVEIWDLNNGTLQKNLPEYGSGYGIPLISTDSKQLVVVNSNIHILDIPQQKWLAPLPVESGVADSAVFSPAGNVLAVSSENNIYLWDTNKLERLFEIPIAIEGQLLAFSEDGSLLAAADFEQILIFDTTSGESIQKIEMEFSNPYTMCFSEDNTNLYYASEQERNAWKINSGKKLYSIPFEEYAETNVALSPNLGLIIEKKSYTESYFYSFYDPQTGDIQHFYTIYELSRKPGVFLEPIGNMLMINFYGSWLFYSPTNIGEVWHKSTGSTFGFNLSKNSDLLVYKHNLEYCFILIDISSYANYVKYAEFEPIKPLPNPTAVPALEPTLTATPILLAEPPEKVVPAPEVAQVIGPENVTSLKLLNELGTGSTFTSAWSEDGQLLAIANERGVEIIQMDTFETIAHIETIEYIDEILFSPDSQYLAMWSYHAQLKVFDLNTEKEIFANYDDNCRDQHIVFGKDSETITLYCETDSYKWKLQTGKLISEDNEPYSGNSGSGNSQDLAFVKENSSMRLVNINTNSIVHTFDLPNYMPMSTGISLDGNILFIWYYEYDMNYLGGPVYPLLESNSILQIWGIDKEQNLILYNSINAGKMTDYYPHPSTAFSIDSKLLYTGIGDGVTRIFKIPSGQLLTTFDELCDFSISSNGKWLYADSMPEGIWDISINTKPTIAWYRTRFEKTNQFLIVTTTDNEMVTLDGSQFKFWEMIDSLVTQPTTVIETKDNEIVSAAVSSDGQWLAYISYKKLVVGKRNGQYVNWHTLRTYSEDAKEYFYEDKVIFSPDNSMLLVLDVYDDIDLWKLDDISNGPIIFDDSFDYNYFMQDGLFSPDSKTLVISLYNDIVHSPYYYFWDVESEELISKTKSKGHSFNFSPDSKIFIEDEDYRLVFYKLYDMEIEDSILFQFTEFEPVFAYNQQGNLITLKHSGQILFYDNETKEYLFSITDPFATFQYTPDGKYLITIGRNNQIKIWGIAE